MLKELIAFRRQQRKSMIESLNLLFNMISQPITSLINAQISIAPSTRCLLEADVSICEEVENNAELTISFKMRKIK